MNFRPDNLTNTHVFNSDNSTTESIAKAIITFCAFFFSAGSFNLGHKNSLLNGFTNLSKNNTYHSNAFGMSISSFENISEKNTIFEEGGNAMSINEKEFGALQQKTDIQEKTITEIRSDIKYINDGISSIELATAKLPTKDDIEKLIEASINKSRLSTIRWIWGATFTVITGIGVITTILFHIYGK
ncbi:MAG: hypothetical protein ACRCZW_15410 [Lactobacillaceae bacterium]